MYCHLLDAVGSEKLEQAIVPKAKSIPLSSPATKILLDTPTRQRVQFQQDEINELKQFEQLEDDFNQNNSALDMDKGRRDDNLVLKFKVGVNLSPKHPMADRNIDDIEEEDEDEEQFQQSISSESSMGDESRHVRFTSNAMAIEGSYRNGAANDMSDMHIYDVPKTSSPHERSTESFQRFKEKLFDRRLKQKFQTRLSIAKGFEISDLNSNKSDCEDEDATLNMLNETHGNEDKEKIRLRLLSLEHEIHSFREQNNELSKLIHEYEMIRLTFDEERQEFDKRMENERISFEMYMHEQRLKMLNERAKWEKKFKETPRGMTQTEKNEIASLREKCANHEAELCNREQKHVAAQARIRAQLRNVEKELKETRFEVENLQRENKKLETENMRLRRQSNSKILTEINKSISKLAHTNESSAHDSQYENEKDSIKEKTVRPAVKKCSNKNAHKTVVAKVTSHREPLNGNHMRSKSEPNLQQSDSNDVEYELCSTHASEDGENSESSTPEGNLDDRSNYFREDSTTQQRYKSANNKEMDRSNSNHCDESDIVSSATKRIIENPDGSKDIWYANGNLKKISADGMRIRMLYFNKDIKETDIKEGIVKYYYAETDTWQTSYLDGLEIFEYPG